MDILYGYCETRLASKVNSGVGDSLIQDYASACSPTLKIFLQKIFLNIFFGGSVHYHRHWGSRWARADLRIMSRQAAMIGEITTTAPCMLYQTTVPDYCTKILHQACCTRLLHQTMNNCTVYMWIDLQHHLPEAPTHDQIEYSQSFIFCFFLDPI